MATPPQSFVTITGPSAHDCGYCHQGGDTSTSFGMWAHTLSVADYQSLIDKGWRRSGCYLYKPDIATTCCPAYTIRLDAGKFVPSKGHKKCVRKMKRFLGEGVGRRKKEDAGEGKRMKVGADDGGEDEVGDGDIGGGDEAGVSEPAAPVQSAPVEFDKADVVMEPALSIDATAATAPPKVDSGMAFAVRDGDANGISEAKKETKKGGKGMAGDVDTPGKGQPWVKQPKKQNAVSDICSLIRAAEAGKAHQLKTVIVPSKFEQETFELYKKYQTVIHNDPPGKVTVSGFTNFLVKSPLTAEGIPTHPFPGYGSFHQKYYLDGRLIAVAVIDVLPACVSSVYFIYDPDPDIMFLSMGVYGALREISLIGEMKVKGLKYYYLGFYIHSCQKMRYKGQYKPSELACPLTYKWVPHELCVPLLDRNKVALLSSALDRKSDANADDIDESVLGPDAIRPPAGPEDVPDDVVGRLPAFSKGKLYEFKKLRAFRDEKEDAKVLVHLLGVELARRVILVLR